MENKVPYQTEKNSYGTQEEINENTDQP